MNEQNNNNKQIKNLSSARPIKLQNVTIDGKDIFVYINTNTAIEVMEIYDKCNNDLTLEQAIDIAKKIFMQDYDKIKYLEPTDFLLVLEITVKEVRKSVFKMHNKYNNHNNYNNGRR